LPLNFASEYAVRNVQEKEEELEGNGTYELPACTGNINLLGGNTNTIEKMQKFYQIVVRRLV
jgi:hypothetical protein